MSGVVRLAGCGGELYCPYQVGPWPAEWEKVWEVMARGSEMQIEMSRVILAWSLGGSRGWP